MADKKSIYAQAAEALEAGKPQQALALCEQVPAGNADAVNARALEAECLAELGRWSEADETAANVLAEDDQWATGYLIRGLAAAERHDIKKAEGFLKQAWKFDNELDDAAYTLSVLADFEGKFAEGDQWLIRAAESGGIKRAPVHLSAAAFDNLLIESVDTFPGQSAQSLDESRFRVLAMPLPRQLKKGAALGDSYYIDELDPEGDPPVFRLTFFQRNLERDCENPADVRKGIDEAIQAALSELTAGIPKE